MAKQTEKQTDNMQEVDQDSYSISSETLAEWIQDAENDSIEHQVKLGTHYLKLAELGVDADKNGIQAVSWFIKASQRGDDTATEKLKHCVITSVGITDANKEDAVWCLNTSSSEKRVRNAAKSLFSRLGASQSGILTKAEYFEAINSLTAGHEKEKKILIAAGKKIGDTISESEFVKTISKKIQGTLTLTSDEADGTSAAYNTASPMKKVFGYPRETAKVLMDNLLEFASKEGLKIVTDLIPTNQLYLLAMIFVYSYLKAELFMFVIPLMTLFISFVVLVLTTLQMFHKKRKQKDASSLLTMLQGNFDPDIDIQSAESQYSWNTVTPFFVFFTTVPIIAVSFAFANKAYVPCAEISVISFGLTITCFFGLSDKHDLITLVALLSHTFSSLPMLLAGSKSIIGVSKAVAYITGPFVSFHLGLGVSFNLSLPSVVHMMIPFLFLRMAMRDKWSGVLKTLVPHLVCYCWFSLATAIFPYTTWYGIARATIGYLFLPMFVTFTFVFVILGLFYMFYKLLLSEVIGKLVVTMLLIGVTALLSQTKLLFGKKAETPKIKKVKNIVMVVFAVAAVIPLLFVRLPSASSSKSLDMSLEDYQSLCVANEGETVASYQLRCHDFVGVRVNWTGIVTQVKISKVENSAENVLNSLPTFIAQTLNCIYGEPLPACDSSSMGEKAFRHCQLMNEKGNACHLHGHDVISFSMGLTVGEDGLNVNLEASNSHRAKLLALEIGDEVLFSGTLLDAGNISPSVKLKSLKCTSRVLPVMEEVIEEDILDEEHIFKMAGDALNILLNFGLFPVISFSPVF